MSEKNETAVNTPPSLGARLRTARKGANLAIADVANQLNLSRTTIEAIENDNYDNFSATIYVRGYLRSYAKLLSLDVNEILQMFAEANFSEKIKATAYPEFYKTKSEPVFNINLPRYVSFAVGALFFILLLLWWHGQNKIDTKIQPLNVGAETTGEAIELPQVALELGSETVSQ